MSFSEIIKMTKQKVFLIQEIFSYEINSVVTSINRWETDKSKPNLTTMKHIRKFCEKNNLPYEKNRM